MPLITTVFTGKRHLQAHTNLSWSRLGSSFSLFVLILDVLIEFGCLYKLGLSEMNLSISFHASDVEALLKLSSVLLL